MFQQAHYSSSRHRLCHTSLLYVFEFLIINGENQSILDGMLNPGANQVY